MLSLLLVGPTHFLLNFSMELVHPCCRHPEAPLFPNMPVLTEVLYLLGPSIKAQRAGLEFILKGGAMLVPQSQESLRRGLELMEKYGDIPMDFADATLVVLAEEMGITESFTLDGWGFNTYRMQGKKGFRLWPE